MNRIGADYLMRGLRNTTDFQYERDIAAMNNFLDDQCETVFFLAKPEYQHLSSSILRKLHLLVVIFLLTCQKTLMKH